MFSVPAGSSLLEDVIHVWSTELDAPDSRWAASLDADEAARARRFHFEHDRRHYTAARGCLRLLLGRYLDVPSGAVRFSYGTHGKPQLADASRDIRFNVSHSHGRALLAFTRGRDVGIDLEAGARLGDDWPGLVRRVFSTREQAELAALPVEQKRLAFLNGWTRKEAYLKATGLGITEGLQSIEVTLDPAQPPALRHPRGRGGTTPARPWTIRMICARMKPSPPRSSTRAAVRPSSGSTWKAWTFADDGHL